MDRDNLNEEIKEETAEEISEETAEKTPGEDSSESENSAPEEKGFGKKKEEKKLKAKAALLEKENEQLKAALEETKDSHLRVAAEYENFRKRTQKEKEGIYSDAVSDTVKELLPLFDDLDRASSFAGENVDEGLALILKSVPAILSKLHVETFGEPGDTFDPNVHDAMMHEENDQYGESEIVEVFRKGYKIHDKIIRHALVKVAN